MELCSDICVQITFKFLHGGSIREIKSREGIPNARSLKKEIIRVEIFQHMGTFTEIVCDFAVGQACWECLR